MCDIVFAHVMKTAGCAIKKMFTDNFPDRSFMSYTFADSDFLSYENMMEINSRTICKPYYGDHRASFLSVLPFDWMKAFTVVRDPYSRFVSFYNYCNHLYEGQYFSEDWREAITDIYIHRNVNPKVSGQLLHISQFRGFNFVKMMVLERNCLIIPYEYVADVSTIFGVGLPIDNVTQVKVLSKVTPEVKELVGPFVKDDLNLHEWSLEYYEQNRDAILERWLDI